MSTKATVVVYATGGCQACRLTQRALDKAGIAYEIVDLHDNEAARELVRALEFRAAPVVTTGDRWWSGFRPDKIRELADG